MKKIRLLLLFPFFLGLVLISRLVGLAGPATLKGDMQDVFDFVASFFELVWVWLATPSVLESTIALFAMTITWIFAYLGETRILNAFKFLFRKDFRQAQFMTIVEDKEIQQFKKSVVAKTILDELDWSNYMAKPEPLPAYTNRQEYTDMGLVGSNTALSSRRVDRELHELIHCLSTFGNGPLNAEENWDYYHRRLKLARERAYEHRSQWPNYENGMAFDTDASQNRWHEIRFGVVEANKIVNEIKINLERQVNEWKASLDSNSVSQLLPDIGKEKQH